MSLSSFDHTQNRLRLTLYITVIQLDDVLILTSFTAVTPWQAGKICEDMEEVKECPGDDDDVVNILKEDHHHGRVSDTL